MKIVKAITYDNKKYWLIKSQAEKIAKDMKSKTDSTYNLGGDLVRTNTIKSLEATESNILDAPKYFLDLIKTLPKSTQENDGGEPLPKHAECRYETKRYLEDDTETKKTWRQLEKEHTNFTEIDYEVLSTKHVKDEFGKTHIAYELGKAVAMRKFKCVIENGIYYTVLCR